MEENKQNEIKEKILKYFDVEWKLPKLDNPEEGVHAYHRDYYTGVTFNYIKEYVLKNEYSQNEILEVLKNLYFNKEIRGLHCWHIGKFVFEPKTGYLTHDHHKYRYDDFIDAINRDLKINEYKNE